MAETIRCKDAPDLTIEEVAPGKPLEFKARTRPVILSLQGQPIAVFASVSLARAFAYLFVACERVAALVGASGRLHQALVAEPLDPSRLRSSMNDVLAEAQVGDGFLAEQGLRLDECLREQRSDLGSREGH